MFSARSPPLDGVSWVQGSLVEIAVGRWSPHATQSAPSSAPSLGRRSCGSSMRSPVRWIDGLSRRELGFVPQHRVHDDCEATRQSDTGLSHRRPPGDREGPVLDLELALVPRQHDIGGLVKQRPHPPIAAFGDCRRRSRPRPTDTVLGRGPSRRRCLAIGECARDRRSQPQRRERSTVLRLGLSSAGGRPPRLLSDGINRWRLRQQAATPGPSGARADPDRKRLRRAELVQLSGRHRRRYRWRDRFGVAGFEGVLMLVGLSTRPLPQPGRPEKVL